MKSVLLVAALLSSTAGAAFAELQSIPAVPEGLFVGADGLLYFDPNAGKLRAAAGAIPGTVTGPDAAGRFLNTHAPGGPQRQGRALTDTDAPLAVLGLPFDAEGILLDLANPFSGDGFGSRGSVGRGLVPYGAGQQAGAPDQFLQQASAPGRWLTDGAKGTATWLGAAGGAVTALGGALGQAGVVAAGGELMTAGAGIAAAGDLVAGLDYVNPLSGDGIGSQGNVGRSLAAVPDPMMSPVVVLDTLNPWSGNGVGSPGVVGRGMVVPNGGNQLVAVPGRFLTDMEEGFAAGTALGSGLLLGAGAVAAAPEALAVGSIAPIVAGIDALNPWSGDGFWSRGSVGRGLVPNGAGQQVVVPGRWLTETAGGVFSQMGEATFGTTALADFALAEELTAATVASGAGAALGLGALAASTGTWVVDLVNPWSGDGFGSKGAAGRSLAAEESNPMLIPVVVLDTLNPWTGNGVGSPGVVGRGMVVPDGGNQMVAAPGRFITETAPGVFLNAGAAGAAAAAAAGATEAAAAVFVAPEAAAIGALPILIDALNPWSGDGFWSRGSVGRGLGVPGGVVGQMPYYSTGNSVMAPVQYDVGPQGTTISITIPNGYNVGQMGMMPMVPAMSAPQYRVIPQYAAPAPVAYVAPATPVNLAVAPAAANAGVKCQVGDQQAVAPTVDACEEAGGLVQPMDAAQAAE